MVYDIRPLHVNRVPPKLGRTIERLVSPEAVDVRTRIRVHVDGRMRKDRRHAVAEVPEVERSLGAKSSQCGRQTAAVEKSVEAGTMGPGSGAS
jgi:hypothetical protein